MVALIRISRGVRCHNFHHTNVEQSFAEDATQSRDEDLPNWVWGGAVTNDELEPPFTTRTTVAPTFTVHSPFADGPSTAASPKLRRMT